MFNVTVLKMRDIVKYALGLTLTMILVMAISKYIPSKKTEKSEESKLQNISFGSLVGCLDETLPAVSNIDEDKKLENENITEKKYLEEFLKTEISSMRGIEAIEKEVTEDKEKIEKNEAKEENKENKEELTLANTDSIKTEVVTQNPITESFNVQYGKVKIKNQTSYTLAEDMLKPDITIENKNVLIFHTHSCESYTSSEKYPYTPSGNFRSTDLNYTVTRVGTELENYLKKYNINVTHDKSYHDYPAYNGSYTRSLATVENILKTTSSDIIIDLHRDAIGSREDYAPTVKIGEDYCAQIMFVVGTNDGGLWHPNWNQNLKFAIKIQEKAEEMYPGLFKPIMVTTSRYNQHTGKYANIMEIGATGNTLEQCLNTMKYLSAVMNEVMK